MDQNNLEKRMDRRLRLMQARTRKLEAQVVARGDIIKAMQRDHEKLRNDLLDLWAAFHRAQP